MASVPSARDEYSRPRLHRVGRNGRLHAVLLGEVRGLFTHWDGKRSRVCHGEERCPNRLHSGILYEKGYVAVMGTLDPSGRPVVFRPLVLELASNTLADLPSTQLRGQYWQFISVDQANGHHIVKARYRSTWRPGSVPPAFDVTAYVQRAMNEHELPWHVPALIPPLPEVPRLTLTEEEFAAALDTAKAPEGH